VVEAVAFHHEPPGAPAGGDAGVAVRQAVGLAVISAHEEELSTPT
jgi:hypothetical protein